MSYKVIRNAAGDMICYGPNDKNYEPTIAAGNALFIEAAIPAVSLAQINAEASAAAKAALILLDAGSIRAIREYIINKADAPQSLKDRDAAAALERAKIT